MTDIDIWGGRHALAWAIADIERNAKRAKRRKP